MDEGRHLQSCHPESQEFRRYDASNALCALRNSHISTLTESRLRDILQHRRGPVSSGHGSMDSGNYPHFNSHVWTASAPELNGQYSAYISPQHQDEFNRISDAQSHVSGTGQPSSKESLIGKSTYNTKAIQKGAAGVDSSFDFNTWSKSPSDSFMPGSIPVSYSSLISPDLRATQNEFEDLENAASQSSASEGRSTKNSYAWLIYRALMDAEDHKLSLQQIYKWVAKNTDKAINPAFKGWQNSIRHNLSMNGVSQGWNTVVRNIFC